MGAYRKIFNKQIYTSCTPHYCTVQLLTRAKRCNSNNTAPSIGTIAG